MARMDAETAVNVAVREAAVKEPAPQVCTDAHSAEIPAAKLAPTLDPQPEAVEYCLKCARATSGFTKHMCDVYGLAKLCEGDHRYCENCWDIATLGENSGTNIVI